jgi:recombinational DNA repair protein RecR
MEQIFQAHGTIRMEPIRLALMIQRRNARAAIIAVHKICIAFHATNAAFIAVVIISLNAIVKKVAHGAKVGGELGAAMKACVGHGLPFIARRAHHFFDGMAIHLVRFGVVVAVTAHIRIVAARSH